MTENPVIAHPDPRRSWLIHCNDADGNFGVCNLTVSRGSILIYAPNGSDTIDLTPTGIAEFREAFTEALAVAESDLKTMDPVTPPQP